MPRKKKNNSEENTEEVFEVVEEAFESVPTSPPPAPNPSLVGRRRAAKEKRMTFDSYAKRKGFKDTHIPGLRAYTKNPNIPRTMEEWDEFFKNY